jgi:predicted acylesterase/phospholipase RssA/CRP-like cAMP-binding protein
MIEMHQGLAEAIAAADLLAGLGTEARQALIEAASTAVFRPGEPLFPEGCGADALYVVREGTFHAIEPDPPKEPRLVRVLQPGEVVDGVLELAGERRPVAVRSVGEGVATVVPGAEVDRLVAMHADLRAARERLHRLQLLSGLSSVFGPIDADLLNALEAEADWTHLHRGEVLWEPGAVADGLFFVISGRVAALAVNADGTEELHHEIARGDTIGTAGFLDGRPRKFRLRATRDTLLVGYTSAEFERLIARHPQVVRRITAVLVARAESPRRGTQRGVSTVMLIPASHGAPVRELADRLAAALSIHGSVLRLDSSRVERLLNEPGIANAAEDSAEERQLLAWLDACESRHRFVLFEADASADAWTQRCIRRADRLLLVARAGDPSERSDAERTIMRRAIAAPDTRASLVLIHPNGARPPSGTRRWLDARPEVSEHFHLRWDGDADIHRLARGLAGRSIGLVMSGGGARGYAHIGLLRAMEEKGIPIDAVGGTSMGASVAGQCAMGRDAGTIVDYSRKVFLEVKPHRGYRLPLLSLMDSSRFERAGVLAYGEVAIEDLWLPFFCVSSNLTTASVMVHRRGTLWKACLASSSLPGVGIPVLHETHLLCDGGLLNNLPTDIMRAMGHGTVIASAVSCDESSAFTCERVPTTWEALRARIGRARHAVKFPTLLQVVVRASLLHSTSSERASITEADLSVCPPLEDFSLLDFERIDEIVEAGYRAAEGTIARWPEQLGLARH